MVCGIQSKYIQNVQGATKKLGRSTTFYHPAWARVNGDAFYVCLAYGILHKVI